MSGRWLPLKPCHAQRQLRPTVWSFCARASLRSVAQQVGRMLAKLVGSCTLVHVSKDVYAETRINRFTGKLSPAAPFDTIAAETFPHLGRFPSLRPT